jgi:hypothetical protein
MSDYEAEGWGDEEGYGQEDNGGANDDGQVEIDNNYFEAADIWKKEPEKALEKFEVVIMMEESRDNPEHSFSSLKHVIIIYMQLKQYERMQAQTTRLLQYSSRPTVSKN